MLGITNVLLLLPVYAFARCNDIDLTVTLRNPPNSQIKGECKKSHQSNTYYSFTGVPFAEPPVGEKRLQKPEPVRPWKGIYDATKNDKKCPQDAIFQGAFIVGSEDCLYLNVYTPTLAKNSSKLLPVLLWFHGGGFQFGSGIHMLFAFGSFDKFDPAFFMDEEIVVVSPNYRLGALGFLTTEDDVIPANLGHRDQLLALKWVQDNIELFGGDPKDIVIAGESSGSASVCYHLLSDVPEINAVTGAIMISGTCIAPWAFVTNATENAFDVGKKLGSDYSSDHNSASLLRLFQSVSTEDFLHAAEMIYRPIKTDLGSLRGKWAPTYAEDFSPAEPMTDVINQGKFHKVPLLFGFNSEECLSPLYLQLLPQIYRKAIVWDKDPSKMIENTLNVRDRRKAGEDMKAIYTNSSFLKDIAALVKYCTDDQFTLPVGRHAESASKYGVPVYMYQMAYHFVPHFTPGIEGAGHAEDMFLYWDTFLTKLLKLIFPKFDLVSRRMVRLLSNFVKHKKPIVEKDELFQNLEWPEFDSKHLQYMRIDAKLEVRSDIRNYSSKRVVWDKHVQKPTTIY